MFGPAEKEIAIRRSKQAFNTPHTGVKVHQLIAVLKDRKIWCYGEEIDIGLEWMFQFC